jgi:hypothetical protein
MSDNNLNESNLEEFFKEIVEHPEWKLKPTRLKLTPEMVTAYALGFAEKLAEVEVIVKDLSAAWENHCCGEPNRDVINQLIEKLEGMFEGDE